MTNMFYLLAILTLFSSAVYAETSAIDQRLEEETTSESVNFSLTPHQPNYILPVYLNQNIKEVDAYQDENSNSSYEHAEVKFQISLKMPLFHELGNLPISGYVAYTQLSLWQAYNTSESSPFRETNYEPEAFLVWETDQNLPFGWRLKSTMLGFTHQSNGLSEPDSRSWNRLNSSLTFDKQNLVVTVNPWYRFEDSDDDNPELLDYYGHGQFIIAYKSDEHVYSLISRNNIESGFSQGSINASWSFPLYGKVKGYAQIFSGYGNSLIEYDQYTNTVGLGISVTDFL
jgi:phospholipase A1